jgi:hypothetical protein
MNENLRMMWYSKDDVQSNIIPLIRGREVCFLVPGNLRKDKGNYPIRCIKAHASSYLMYNMNAFNFFSREYNLYHGIFLLNNMPQFSLSPLKRTEQQHAFFKNFNDFVTGLDFVMDFDGDKTLELNKRIDMARIQTIKVCNILDEYKVPYNLVFSGSKGFHIEVRDFPTTRNWNERMKQFEQIAIRLVLLANGYNPQLANDPNNDSQLLDIFNRCSFDSSIYNVTRIWKVPYSYDVSTDMIAYPLNNEEIKDFNINNYKAEELIKKNHWGIGLKKRIGTIENFWIMAKELGV